MGRQRMLTEQIPKKRREDRKIEGCSLDVEAD